MKNILKILVAFVIAIFLFFFIKNIISGELEYNTLEFNPVNNIQNYSTTPYADTLSHIGLEYLDLTEEDVVILDATPSILSNLSAPDGRLDGFLIKDQRGVYKIFIRPELSKRRFINILSHELIHVQQQSSGRLVTSNDNIFVFDGDSVSLIDVEYRDRPWEREAYRLENDVERYIKKRVVK